MAGVLFFLLFFTVNIFRAIFTVYLLVRTWGAACRKNKEDSQKQQQAKSSK